MLLSALVNFGKSYWLYPWVYFWPTLDAEASRSGEGTSATKMAGMRYFGQPTAVTRMGVELKLVRSDGRVPPTDWMDTGSPAYIRTLAKDAVWAPGHVAPVAPAREAPRNFHAHLAGSLFQVTELYGPALARQDDQLWGPLYHRAAQMLAGHDGFLPTACARCCTGTPARPKESSPGRRAGAWPATRSTGSPSSPAGSASTCRLR
jgi:hypothetical protein